MPTIDAKDLSDYILSSCLEDERVVGGGYESSLELRGDTVSLHRASRGSYYAPGHGPDVTLSLGDALDDLAASEGHTLESWAGPYCLPEGAWPETLDELRAYALHAADEIARAVETPDGHAILIERGMDTDAQETTTEHAVEIQTLRGDLRTHLTAGLYAAARGYAATHAETLGAQCRSLEDCLTLLRLADTWDMYTDPPTFGGADAYGTNIWSWDETRLLVGASNDDLEIIPREMA